MPTGGGPRALMQARERAAGTCVRPGIIPILPGNLSTGILRKAPGTPGAPPPTLSLGSPAAHEEKSHWPAQKEQEGLKCRVVCTSKSPGHPCQSTGH